MYSERLSSHNRLLFALVLASTVAMVIPIERHIGLILKDKSDFEERVYAVAFDFAKYVVNNNLFNEMSTGQERTLLNPVTTNYTDLEDNYKLGGAICSIVNSGVLLIAGTSHASTFNTIQSYCQALQVPYLLTSPPRLSHYDSYHLDLTVCPPYIDAVIKVISNLTQTNNKVFFVFDSDDGLWRLQRLYQYFQKEDSLPWVMDSYRIRDIHKAYALLRNLDLKDQRQKVIILDLSSEHAYNLVLEQIIDVGMNRENYHYILASADALDLDLRQDFYSQFLYGGVKITGFRLVDNATDNYRRWEQLWRQHKDGYQDLFPLKTGSALMMDLVWLAHLALRSVPAQSLPDQPGNAPDTVRCSLNRTRPSLSGPAIMNELNKVGFNGLTGHVSLKRGHRKTYSISVYELQYRQPMQLKAKWTQKDLSVETIQMPIPETITPNKTQRITTILESPFVMEAKKKNGAPAIRSQDYLEGYCIDLIELLSKAANFDYHVYLTNEYGEKNETTGKWNGMIGQLIRKERDMAVAPLSITEERERVVDFSKPFMNTGISIMIKKPEKVKPGVFSFMAPLDTQVWLCIAIGFLAVSFVLFFVGRFSPYEWNVAEDSKERTATTIFTISNTLWFSLGALMRQGSDISPRSFSGRVVGSAWWFFTLIIISSYTANLAAFLTIEKLVSPIDSADDLVDHPTIKYGTKKTGTSWRFFQDSSVETFVRMRKEMLKNEDVLFSDYEQGVAKLRDSKGNYAFLLESAMNTYYGQQEPCDTMMVGEPLDNKGYGVASYLHHPLRHNINIAVLTLKEKGELIKLKQKWWMDKGQCGDQTTSKESTGTKRALTLSHVSGIFHILIGGLVLAMITSSIEYLIQRKLRKSRKNSAADKKKDKRYQLPIPPPPPPRRSCYSSSSDRPPAGSGPAYSNGFSTEVDTLQEDLMTNRNDMNKWGYDSLET